MVTIDTEKIRIDATAGQTRAFGNAAIDVLRLDLLHPIVSGNKWFKLFYNIEEAKAEGRDTLITFGGAWSNHLVATAAAAKAAGFKSLGLVRGLHGAVTSTPILQLCRSYGMQLEFLTRSQYKSKAEKELIGYFQSHHPTAWIIPEGGANEAGRTGAAHITEFIPPSYTHVCISVGTGSSFIGLRNALPASTRLLGFAPMKSGSYLNNSVANMLLPEKNCNFELLDRWHFGGFGKWKPELISFMNQFYEETSMPLDVVYTGKMMYGVSDLLKEGYFSSRDRVLCIHTGGLPGNASVSNLLRF